MTRTEIITLQRQLKAAGYHITRIDGIYGPETATAYQAWLDYNTPKTLPTPAPKPVTPWWRHKVVLGILATVLAGITSRWGVDSNELLEILLKLTEVAGLILAAWGTAPSQATAVDPTLMARFGGESLRLPGAHPLPAQRPNDRETGPFGY
ncbi:MAG: peptidoglycan-binding protein [Chromatiaceae bacterium]|nr:peptidoglycan-binding protein [Chromatiaceae bacterium]